MNQIVKLQNNSGNLVVSSRVIAKEIGKEHSKVIRSLEEILEKPDVASLIIPSTYIVKGQTRKYKEYLLTKKGFILYMFNIQGYNDFKLAYINEFERMESILRNRESSDWLITRQQGKLVRRMETDAIQELIPYAIGQGSQNANMLYMTYSKLVNNLVGVQPNSRDTVEFKKLLLIHQLEDMFSKIIWEGMKAKMYYKEIYQTCKAKGQQLIALLSGDLKAIGLN